MSIINLKKNSYCVYDGSPLDEIPDMVKDFWNGWGKLVMMKMMNWHV